MTPQQLGQTAHKPEMNNNKGFTLIELLIGMAIFAIGTLAIAGLQTHATNMNTNARRSLEIESHVARLVENYKNIAWNDLLPLAAPDGVIDDCDFDGDGVVDVLEIHDLDGDGIGGIDHTGAAADYFTNGSVLRAGDNYRLSINVAPNVLEPDTLTINIIAQWTHLGQAKRYNVLFLKARNV